jgi:hypothetical protein
MTMLCITALIFAEAASPTASPTFPHLSYFIFGLLGAVAAELIQIGLYPARLKMSKTKGKDKTKELYRSSIFWYCEAALVVGSGLLAWGLFAG